MRRATRGAQRSEECQAIRLDEEYCKGCYICISVCPSKVLDRASLVGPKGFCPVIEVHSKACTQCLLCEFLCPDLAIEVLGKVPSFHREVAVQP